MTDDTQLLRDAAERAPKVLPGAIAQFVAKEITAAERTIHKGLAHLDGDVVEEGFELAREVLSLSAPDTAEHLWYHQTCRRCNVLAKYCPCEHPDVAPDTATRESAKSSLDDLYIAVRELQIAAAERGQSYHLQAQSASGEERTQLLSSGHEAFYFNVFLKDILGRFAHLAPVELTDEEARSALWDARQEAAGIEVAGDE